MLIPTISVHLQLLSVEFRDTCTHICKKSFSLNEEKGSERQQHKEIMATLSPSEIPQNTFYGRRLGTRFASDSTVSSGEVLNTINYHNNTKTTD